MGTALLDGFLRKPSAPRGAALQLAACVRSQQSVNRLRSHLGEKSSQVDIGHGNEAVAMAERAQMIILGCRPQDLSGLLSTPKLPQTFAGKTIVSMLAGVATKSVREQIATHGGPGDAAVVLVQPSIGAKFGSSVSVVAAPEGEEESGDLTEEVFSNVGSVVRVAENMLTKGIAVNAVGHALAIQAVDAMTDACVAEGVPREDAVKLAQAYLRSGASCMENGMTAESLKAAVSTPSGVTLNAVVDLEKNGVRAGIGETMRSAVRYAGSM